MPCQKWQDSNIKTWSARNYNNIRSLHFSDDPRSLYLYVLEVYTYVFSSQVSLTPHSIVCTKWEGHTKHTSKAYLWTTIHSSILSFFACLDDNLLCPWDGWMAGTDGFWECEGVDQPDMKLPGRQAKHEKRETGRVFMADTSSIASERYFCIHPWKLTWNLNIPPWKRRNIYKWPVLGFHVSFRGCIWSNILTMLDFLLNS